jgi:hypothetical protein
MGISTKYELSNKSFPLLVHEMCNEEDLGKILTNLSSNNKELKEFVINNKNEFSLIWEKLWEKFSSNNNSQNWNNNFLNDPNKIFVALHKIGIDTPTLYEFDKSINFYLSHFLLQKSNDKIMDAFIEKGFYKKEWFENNFDDQKWEELINNKNPTIFYTLRNHLNTSVFDVAPKKYHQDLLKLLVNSCSDFDINFAIKGERFDIELINTVFKKGKQEGTYLHKFLTKNLTLSFITAINLGANYKIPEGKDIITYMSDKAKYSDMLKELKPTLWHNELQEKMPNATVEYKKKMKI